MRWVRPIISLAFAGAVIYAWIGARIITTEAALPIVTAVIIWWFKSRDETINREKKND
jgi:hypothetical protein